MNDTALYFFKCSVSADLYGAALNVDGTPLPTPGGGSWIPLDDVSALGDAKHGFVESEAREALSVWGCHWFTSTGGVEITWGPDGPPKVKA